MKLEILCIKTSSDLLNFIIFLILEPTLDWQLCSKKKKKSTDIESYKLTFGSCKLCMNNKLDYLSFV